jgi:hypothetical protein
MRSDRHPMTAPLLPRRAGIGLRSPAMGMATLRSDQRHCHPLAAVRLGAQEGLG